MFSQITSGLGIHLPTAELCALARDHGVISIVDGAQAIGQGRVDVKRLGYDAFVGSPHKWLMAPKGTGALHQTRHPRPRIDPKKKLQRRRKREPAAASRSNEVQIENEPARTRSRYIPSEVTERVHERRNHRCEFRAEDGTRCTPDRPRDAVRHSSEPRQRFLRLLCSRHNRFTAARVYGAAFVQRKIQARTDARSP